MLKLRYNVAADLAFRLNVDNGVDPVTGEDRHWGVDAAPLLDPDGPDGWITGYHPTLWVVTCSTNTTGLYRLDEVDIGTTVAEMQARATQAIGLAYDSDEAMAILNGDNANWLQHYPEINREGNLTGEVIPQDGGDYIVVNDLAMIRTEDYPALLANAKA